MSPKLVISTMSIHGKGAFPLHMLWDERCCWRYENSSSTINDSILGYREFYDNPNAEWNLTLVRYGDSSCDFDQEAWQRLGCTAITRGASFTNKEYSVALFEVSHFGGGFALDMLRYAQAIPASQEDCEKIIDAVKNHAHHRIRLKFYHVGSPARAKAHFSVIRSRWNTFGADLVKLIEVKRAI